MDDVLKEANRYYDDNKKYIYEKIELIISEVFIGSFKSGYYKAKNEIEQANVNNGWIYIADKIPPIREDIQLFTCDDYGDVLRFYSRFGMYIGDGIYIADNDVLDEVVIGWKPLTSLPDYYKSKEQYDRTLKWIDNNGYKNENKSIK